MSSRSTLRRPASSSEPLAPLPEGVLEEPIEGRLGTLKGGVDRCRAGCREPSAGPLRETGAAATGRAPPKENRMAIRRMDNVLIVVDVLEAATAFFVDLGMDLEG